MLTAQVFTFHLRIIVNISYESATNNAAVATWRQSVHLVVGYDHVFMASVAILPVDEVIWLKCGWTTRHHLIQLGSTATKGILIIHVCTY